MKCYQVRLDGASGEGGRGLGSQMALEELPGTSDSESSWWLGQAGVDLWSAGDTLGVKSQGSTLEVLSTRGLIQGMAGAWVPRED